MGCSSSSQVPQQVSDESLPQSQQEYIEIIRQEQESNLKKSQAALDSLKIESCDKLGDASLRQSCQYQVIMTMSAAGDKSLCSRLDDQQDKELCQQ